MGSVPRLGNIRFSTAEAGRNHGGTVHLNLEDPVALALLERSVHSIVFLGEGDKVAMDMYQVILGGFGRTQIVDPDNETVANLAKPIGDLGLQTRVLKALTACQSRSAHTSITHTWQLVILRREVDLMKYPDVSHGDVGEIRVALAKLGLKLNTYLSNAAMEAVRQKINNQ